MNTDTGDRDAPTAERSATVDDATVATSRAANDTAGGDRSSINDALAFTHA
jgi:hypothetical protein